MHEQLGESNPTRTQVLLNKMTPHTTNHEHVAGSLPWYGLDASDDGSVVIAAADSQYIYTYGVGGATWMMQTGSPNRQWRAAACDANCTRAAATVIYSTIWTSQNSGVSWTSQSGSSTGDWRSIALSSNGSVLVGAMFNKYIYVSVDGGIIWNVRITDAMRGWNAVACR